MTGEKKKEEEKKAKEVKRSHYMEELKGAHAEWRRLAEKSKKLKLRIMAAQKSRRRLRDQKNDFIFNEDQQEEVLAYFGEDPLPKIGSDLAAATSPMPPVRSGHGRGGGKGRGRFHPPGKPY
jgi:hypothetical protein